MDVNTNIDFFKKEVEKFVKERNWTKYHTPKNLIQAIQIEAAELSELFLFKEDTEIFKNLDIKKQISEEIADVFIYIISLINALDLDLTQAFTEKMKKNRLKYSINEFNNGIYYKK
jgi:NTP pyrophosphatase (non-canonical NTP hydrolase)